MSVASDAVPAEPLTSPSNSSPSFRGFVAPELGAVERSVNDMGSPFLPRHGGAHYFITCIGRRDRHLTSAFKHERSTKPHFLESA